MAKQSSNPKVVTKKHQARLERERRQIRLIRTISIIGILLVLGLITFGYLKLNVLSLHETVEEVNGVKISSGEWQERVKLQRMQLVNYYNQYSFYQQSFGVDYSQQLQQINLMMSDSQTLGQQVLDQMRDEVLIRQEAQKGGITVSEADVEKAVQESLGFFPNGTPSPTTTPTEVASPTMSSQQLTLYPSTSTPTLEPTGTVTPTATLDLSATPAPSATATPAFASPTPVPQLPTETATPFTLQGYQAKYQEALKNYKTYNISEKTVRKLYEAQLLRQKLLDEITKDTPKTEEQVWARHILVDNDIAAVTIEGMLKRGEDFAALAKKYSKDTGSGQNGGDLGWFSQGQMVPEFEAAAFKLKVGEISEPIKTTYGYHIIQVLGHADLPLTASQYDQAKQKAFDDWLASARKAAKVTTFDVWKDRVPAEPTMPPAQ
jgi:parvulin-like peptidyl-prolyl isomerase